MTKDDGSSSTGVANTIEVKKRKTIPSYCVPWLFVKYIKGFSEKKKRIIRSIGFGPLMNMIDKAWSNDLIYSLASTFDPNEVALKFGESSIPILPLLDRVFGLPNGSVDILPEAPSRQLKKHYQMLENLSVVDLLNKAKHEEDDDNFVVQFLLAVLSFYLAPTQSSKVNMNYLGVIYYNLHNISGLGFARYAGDFLVQGLKQKHYTGVFTYLQLYVWTA